MKTARIILIIVLIILAINQYSILAIPPIAAEFYGTARTDNTDVSIGTNVSAYDPNSTLCGYFIVSTSGYYGSLSCKGDDTETAADEGAVNGDNITFYIGGNNTAVAGNISWVEGRYSNVNISIYINHAPTFNHTLTDQTVGDNHQLLYDINCTDQDGDSLSYYDNTTLFNISSSSGLIDWTPTQNNVGAYSINVTCGDGQANISGKFDIVVSDVNNAPILSPIGPQIATEGTLFGLDVDATDPDNDSLTYSVNTTLFTINRTTGIINFTPTLAQVGNYSINVSANDSLLIDFEVISFRIVRGPYCGDGGCGSSEDCSSCQADCGSCPSAPGAEAGAETGAGEGAEAATTARRRIISVCHERWECSDWSTCSIDGLQTRKCVDVNTCNTKKKEPSKTQLCEYMPSCSDGIRNGDETGVDCGGGCQACRITETCSDGIQNQNEEGIDCGGPCGPCEIKKYAKMPIPELAPLIKNFPWLLFLIVSVLISSTIMADKVYIKRITKKEFEEYRKRIRKYKRIRKNIYITSAILSFIGLTFIFYIYLMSDKPELMSRFIWIPLASIIVIPSLTFFLSRHFKYYEYRKRKKSEEFSLEHKKRKGELIRVEDELLISLELKAINRIVYLLKENVFKEEISSKIEEIAVLLKDLIEKRKEKAKEVLVNGEIKDLVSYLSVDFNLADLSKDYPEFKNLLTILRGLNKNDKNKGNIEKIERFLLSVAQIANDKHLISVINSSADLAGSYNTIVDLYEYYKGQIDNKSRICTELIEKEALFSRKLEEITNKPIIIETIKANAKYASLYNSLVDLYNHYKKRQELNNALSSA